MKMRLLLPALCFCLVPAPRATAGPLVPYSLFAFASADAGLGHAPAPVTSTSNIPIQTADVSDGSTIASASADYGTIHTLVKARASTDGVTTQIAQANTESQFQDLLQFFPLGIAPGTPVPLSLFIRIDGTALTPVSGSNLSVVTVRYTFDTFDANGDPSGGVSGTYTQRSNGFNDGANFLNTTVRLDFTAIAGSNISFNFDLDAGAAANANFPGSAADVLAFGDLSHTVLWGGITFGNDDPYQGSIVSISGHNWAEASSDAPEPSSALLVGALVALRSLKVAARRG